MAVQICGRVESLVEAAEGGCILIEGDAGMGKSRLMEEIQRSHLGGKRDALTMLFSSADFDHRGQVIAAAISDLQSTHVFCIHHRATECDTVIRKHMCIA